MTDPYNGLRLTAPDSDGSTEAEEANTSSASPSPKPIAYLDPTSGPSLAEVAYSLSPAYRRKPMSNKHLAALEVWYSCERSFRIAAAKAGVPERTLREWGKKWSWDIIAESRDREVMKRVNAEAVKRRLEMTKRHVNAAKILQAQGLGFLTQKAPDGSLRNKVEKAGEASALIQAGIKLERQAEGLPDWAIKLMDQDDEALINEYLSTHEAIRRALGSSGSGDEEAWLDAPGDADPPAAEADTENG